MMEYMDSMADTIRAERLELVLMAPSFLEASLAGDQAAVTSLLGASIPEDWWKTTDLMRLRLDQLRANMSLQPWLMRAIILRQERVMVGHIGFHSAPEPDYLQDIAPGGIELGYTIYEPFRRNGYAIEACQALMRWAHEYYDLRYFVLSISPTNTPSIRIAERFAFRKIATQIDPDDGPEDVFILDMHKGNLSLGFRSALGAEIASVADE